MYADWLRKGLKYVIQDDKKSETFLYGIKVQKIDSKTVFMSDVNFLQCYI